jgi:cellulose synthase/poly-beta-1,6-N-acetylglucosamine synthase-like glycosyltransferase
VISFVLLALVIGFQIFTAVLVCQYLSRSRAVTAKMAADTASFSFPGLSVLVPVKGPVRHLEKGLSSLMRQDYPGPLEIVLAFQDADDPSLFEAEQLISKLHSRSEVKILRGLTFLGLNPKNSNLAHAFRASKHPWIFTCDIDTCLSPGHLRRAVMTAEAHVDLFVASITVHEGARTLGALLETIGTNLSLTSYFIQAYRFSPKPGPVNGAASLFSRDLLTRAGGFEITLNAITDDAVLERAFLKAGGTGRLSPDFVRVVQDNQTMSGYFQRFVRWMMIARCYFPLSVITPVFWIGQWMVLFGMLFRSHSLLVGGLCVFASRICYSMVLQRFLGTPTADWPKALVIVLCDAVGPVLWFASCTKKTVCWGGTLLRVQKDGSLVRVSEFRSAQTAP